MLNQIVADSGRDAESRSLRLGINRRLEAPVSYFVQQLYAIFFRASERKGGVVTYAVDNEHKSSLSG
jgi:hypothetical protein